ncbi:UNVERIFIED_CONTAM: Serologically defined colon cancer antigen 8 [Gekko kuhli]
MRRWRQTAPAPLPTPGLPATSQRPPALSEQRLHQLDKHCQSTALQLVELLNKQNHLYKEKQALAEEVDRLQTQLPQVPKP